jgi:hypothetical protein
MSFVTAQWNKLHDRYYWYAHACANEVQTDGVMKCSTRKREIYTMAWAKDDLDLNKYSIASGAFGGPIGDSAHPNHPVWCGPRCYAAFPPRSTGARREEDSAPGRTKSQADHPGTADCQFAASAASIQSVAFRFLRPRGSLWLRGPGGLTSRLPARGFSLAHESTAVLL